jgi:Fe-S cluster biogenesis protein NfuA
VPVGTLPEPGPADAVPEPLATVRADGTVAWVVVGEDHVAVTLTPGRTWREEGARVRSALLAALERPGEWSVVPMDVGAGPGKHAEQVGGEALDDQLAAAARDLLDGEVGELAGSHGGSIELDSVADGVVTVRLRGACHGCPAAGMTLHALLERRLREACPDVREVRSLDPAPARRGPTWLTLGTRRG